LNTCRTWKPKEIKHYPISITSVQKSDYQDKIIDDSNLRYSYRGTDPNHNYNMALREAMKNKIPLIYFHQLMKGKYFVTWPFSSFPYFLIIDIQRSLF
jgi:putative restriction endonuclease